MKTKFRARITKEQASAVASDIRRLAGPFTSDDDYAVICFIADQAACWREVGLYEVAEETESGQ